MCLSESFVSVWPSCILCPLHIICCIMCWHVSWQHFFACTFSTFCKLFFSCTLSESASLTFLFLWKRKSESYIDWIFQWLSVYRDLDSSSSSWLAEGNSHKEEPSSVLETCCHPDETTMERHIFNDVVTLYSKNGKKSRKQRISECELTW